MTNKSEIFDLSEVEKLGEDRRKIFEYIYSKQDLSKYVQLNTKKYTDKSGRSKEFSLKYLSWAYAYREMIRLDPDATYKEHTWPMLYNDKLLEEYQVPYMRTETGYYVRVSVTMFGRTTSEWLAVMDGKNKAIKTPDSTQINKALKRCFVKALALQGLGLYLYVGEDLPEDIQTPEPPKMASDEQKAALTTVFTEISDIKNSKASKEAAIVMKKMKILNSDGKVKSFDDLTESEFTSIMALAKAELAKTKRQYEEWRKKQAEKQARDAELAKELENLGYESKDDDSVTQNEPQTPPKQESDQLTKAVEKPITSASNTEKQQPNSDNDIISKYNTIESDQGSLFKNLGDLLDRGPVAN